MSPHLSPLRGDILSQRERRIGAPSCVLPRKAAEEGIRHPSIVVNNLAAPVGGVPRLFANPD